MISYLAFRLGILLCRFTPIPIGYAISAFFGSLVYLFSGEKRKLTVENMLVVTGGELKRAKQLARASFQEYGKFCFEFIKLSSWPRQQLLSWPIENEKLLIEAMARKRGIVMVTFHYGNWDLAGSTVGLRGYPVHAIADVVGNPKFNRLIVSTRESFGVVIVPTGKARQVIHDALITGSMAVFLADRPLEKNGVEVKLFDRSVCIPRGAAHFALKTNATILVGYVKRLGLGRFAPVIRTEITYNADLPYEDNLQIINQKIMDCYEHVIREDPRQWYMFRRMFKD